MTGPLGAALPIAFALGVVVGFLGRAWLEGRRTMHLTFPAALELHTGQVPITPARRRMIWALVVLSVLLSASANVLQIRNGKADSDRLDCSIEYNRLDGVARDDRNAAAETSTTTELDFLRAIRDQTVTPSDDQSAQLTRFLATIDARISSLEAVADSRDQNPYPTPDACADGKITDKERVGR